MFQLKLIRIGMILMISVLVPGCGGKLSFDVDIVSNSTLEGELELATPAAQSPAAGICADLAGEDVVTVTIHPDIPDPRCSFIYLDQALKVINNRDESITIVIGHMEVSLSPGDSHIFDLPFGEYLAPGVHRLDVQPCCGVELFLREFQYGE